MIRSWQSCHRMHNDSGSGCYPQMIRENNETDTGSSIFRLQRRRSALFNATSSSSLPRIACSIVSKVSLSSSGPGEHDNDPLMSCRTFRPSRHLPLRVNRSSPIVYTYIPASTSNRTEQRKTEQNSHRKRKKKKKTYSFPMTT